MLGNLSRTIVAGGVLLLMTGPASGQAGGPLRAAAAGKLVVAPDGGDAEAVRLDPALAPSLLGLPPGSSLLVADWPVAPGVRQEVELTRFDIYSPGARIVKIEGKRIIELPRSRLVFFAGRSAEDPGARLIVSVDPGTRALEGVAVTAEGTHELRPWTKSAAGGYLVAGKEAWQPPGEEPSWSCGEQQEAPGNAWTSSVFQPSALQPATAPAITSLHTAAIAVDTDNELLQLKFANDTTAATNYIANLFARMNLMYERDFLVRLVQGFTILRPSTTADPYVQAPGSATCATCANSSQLSEFSSYWASGCGGACAGVSRALAMMLSGKQSSNSVASGIARIDALCDQTFGYSFSQVFKFAQDTSANDGSIVGHEIGHNFGSPHTHCYSPPIDTCYNGESCYTGGTSCPAPTTINGVTNVTGTVMSYCHLTSCGSKEVFHPRTFDLVAPKIQARAGQCILPLAPLNSIFGNGFESGTMTSWQ